MKTAARTHPGEFPDTDPEQDVFELSANDLEELEPEALSGIRHRRIAVVESGRRRQDELAASVEEIGLDVVARGVTAVRKLLRKGEMLDILIAGLPTAAKLIGEVVAMPEPRPIVVVSLPETTDSGAVTSSDLGADLFTLRPASGGRLASVLYAASRLAMERDRVRALRAIEETLRERLRRYGEANLATGFQHIDFFKQFLLMEIKRAKRFKYPLATILVALDPPDRPREAAMTRKLRTRIASAITTSIRDIDVPLEFSDDRMLVFLPFTDIDGATAVAKRMARAVRTFGQLVDSSGKKVKLSASIGVSATRAGKPISFSRLVRDATAAIRAAQLKGGGRVVVR